MDAGSTLEIDVSHTPIFYGLQHKDHGNAFVKIVGPPAICEWIMRALTAQYDNECAGGPPIKVTGEIKPS
jgi:hypothetical protein